MTATVAGITLSGDHASRPAASSPPAGSLYSCSDHLLIYRTNGSAWSTYANLSGTGIAASLADNAGDMLVASANDTWAKLATPTVNGQALRRASGSVAWDLPPGHEFTYDQITSDVNVTATSEGSANTIITASSVALDGSTVVYVECYMPRATPTPTADTDLGFVLYDDTGSGAASIGVMGFMRNPAGSIYRHTPTFLSRRLTPSAATHTFSLRGFVDTGTAVIGAGAGGSGANVPTYIRVRKA